LVPIFIIVMRFNERYAIPLSNVTILGGSIANCWFNIFKRHPGPGVDRPMIDFDLVLLMEPPTIAGAVIGSILNKILPELVICALLVLVLGATAIKTWFTGMKARNKELAQESASEEAPLIGTSSKGGSGTGNGTGKSQQAAALFFGGGESSISTAIKENPDKVYQRLLVSEAHWCPWWKVGIITMVLLVVMACNLIRMKVTTCGTAEYWVFMMSPVVIALLMVAFVRSYLMKKSEIRTAAKAAEVEGDVAWDTNTTITYPLLCTLAGLFAGMFGIGGGIVKGPLMLEMGILPEVSAATAAFMIFFTSLTATITYASFGLVKWDWAGLFFVLGFVFTSIGQEMVIHYIASTGRKSVIVFIIAIIVGLSAVLMGYESGAIASTPGKEMDLGNLCKALKS
jgi:uncharacterized membrane protein YfcA